MLYYIYSLYYVYNYKLLYSTYEKFIWKIEIISNYHEFFDISQDTIKY